MLTLNSPTPTRPERVVIMGAGGFVGRASTENLKAEGVNVVALSRKEVDLLASEGATELTRHLTPATILIVTSALAPVKNTHMLLENLRMMQAVIQAVTVTPVAHLVYISSDAVYADSDAPMTEASPAAPSSVHGVMHLTREIMLKSELASIPQVFVRPTLIFGVRTFKLSTDPAFVEKLTDVVGLYVNPPDKALVFCVDEKSQIQALQRSQPGLPLAG